MNQSTRKWMVAILVTAVAASGFACQAGVAQPTAESTAPAPSTAPSETASPLPPPTATPLPQLRLVTGENDEAIPEPKAVINRRIPRLEGAETDAVKAFNSAVDNMVAEEVAVFRDALKDWTPYPDMPDAPSSLLSGYSLYAANQRLVSLKLEFSTYITGAAHPYSYVRTLNFDLKTGRTLDLQDLFRPDVDYLRFLSDACKADLTAKLGADIFAEGADPDLKNFRSWGLTRDGLVIEFDPYQVAAYAAGPQQVLIPYEKMSGKLAEDGPASWVDEPALPVDATAVPPVWPTPVPTP